MRQLAMVATGRTTRRGTQGRSERAARPGGLQWLIGTLAVVVAALASLGAGAIVETRQDAWQQALQAQENLALVISHDLNGTVTRYDHALQAMVDTLAQPGTAALAPDLRHRLLFDRIAAADFAGLFLVLDRDGRVAMDSRSVAHGTDLFAGRDYFEAHRQRNDAGLFIGAPFRSTITGQWSIGISRRVNAPDGSFAGVVVGSLRLAYFRDLLERIRLGDGSIMAVLREDGTVLAFEPFQEALLGISMAGNSAFAAYRAGIPSGMDATSRIDGVRRMHSYAPVGRYGLVVSVGRSVAAIYASWQMKAMVIGGILLLLTALAAGLGLRLLRELRRRERTETALSLTERRYRALAENSSDIIMRLGMDGTCRYVAPSVAEVLGYTPEELVGTDWHAVMHPDDRELRRDAMARLRAGEEQLTMRYRCVRKNGTQAWLEARIRVLRSPRDGTPDEVISNLRDVTGHQAREAHMQAAAVELAELAATDGLTGLANRRQFDDMLSREWRRAAREQTELSLLMLDADCFKAYNDRYGHLQGDTVLREVARAIDSQIHRAGDLGARYGGEEFAVLLPGTGAAGAAQVAETIRRTVAAREIPHGGGPAGVVTVSIGAATCHPSSDATANALIAAADAALYRAKRDGRNRVVSATPFHAGGGAGDVPASPVPDSFVPAGLVPADLVPADFVQEVFAQRVAV